MYGYMQTLKHFLHLLKICLFMEVITYDKGPFPESNHVCDYMAYNGNHSAINICLYERGKSSFVHPHPHLKNPFLFLSCMFSMKRWLENKIIFSSM